jgi:probable DNA metabolism protein
MSELPIENEIIRYGWQILRAARDAVAVAAGRPNGVNGVNGPGGSGPDAGTAGSPASWARLPEAREAAERVAGRLDHNADTVLEAAARTRREAHRLEGLLRFEAGPGKALTARCEPDHFTLPLLAGHFERRFGDQSWIIMDCRRKLWLIRPRAASPRIVEQSEAGPFLPGFPDSEEASPPPDTWKTLWRSYFRAVNNEERKNPQLQRNFMPRRYWKYLPEME